MLSVLCITEAGKVCRERENFLVLAELSKRLGKEVDIKIAITYAQTNDNIDIELISGGLAHDILAEFVDDERMTNLGADIIRNTAKLSSYAYKQGKNIVKITL